MSDLGARDIVILSVAFSADAVEITWTDPALQSARVQEHRVNVIDRPIVDVEIGDMIEAARQALDRALVYRRNPESL